MKVIFTLDSLGIGGTEKSTLDIISKFSSETQTKLVYFYPNHELKEAYEKAGITVQYIQLNSKKSFFEGVRKFIAVLKAEKPDLVVSSIARADLISRIACKITGTKIIGTFVNDTYGSYSIEEQKSKRNYFKFRFYWMLDKWTGRFVSCWISNCESIAHSNRKALGIKPKSIKVIYRGRDTTKFKPWTPLPAEKKFKFAFIGRLIQRKGLLELIWAVDILKKSNPEFRVDIYGKGNFEKQLNAEIEKLGLQENVILHGAVLDGFKKLYEADCFVFPSWYEGFSGALVEAMLSGIPIVASDIEMNKEAVAANQTALIFKVKDAEDLAEKMKQMIGDYPDMIEMGQKARVTAVEKFDINNIAHQYESFLQEVTRNNVNVNELI